MATILLVEDNTDNRVVYRTILQHVGHRVIEAMDGESGVRLAREHRPDLVLMDIAIPGIDGWEATRLLKQDPSTSGIRVVALTAHALAGDRRKAERIGFDGYLAKPISPRQVVERVEALLHAPVVDCAAPAG